MRSPAGGGRPLAPPGPPPTGTTRLSAGLRVEVGRGGEDSTRLAGVQATLPQGPQGKGYLSNAATSPIQSVGPPNPHTFNWTLSLINPYGWKKGWATLTVTAASLVPTASGGAISSTKTTPGNVFLPK
jgi:hypothetical protein